MQKLFENWRIYLNEGHPFDYDPKYTGTGHIPRGEVPESPPELPIEPGPEATGELSRHTPPKVLAKEGGVKLYSHAAARRAGAVHEREPFGGARRRHTRTRPGSTRARQAVESWDKMRDQHVVRSWDVDPAGLTLDQWLEKNGYEHIPAIEGTPGYTMTPEEFYQERGYPVPNDASGGMDWRYLEVPEVAPQPERWRGPNGYKLWGNERPGFVLKDRAGDSFERISAATGEEQARKASGTTVEDRRGLKYMFEQDKKMYKMALGEETEHIRDMIHVTRKTSYIPVDHPRDAKVWVGGSEVETVHGGEGTPKIENLGKRDRKRLGGELDKLLQSPRGGEPSILYQRVKAKIVQERGVDLEVQPGRTPEDIEVIKQNERLGLTSDEIKRESRLLAQELIDENPQIKMVIDPEAYYTSSIIDTSKMSSREVQNLMLNSPYAKYLEHGIIRGTDLKDWHRRKKNFHSALRSVKGQELVTQWENAKNYDIDADFERKYGSDWKGQAKYNVGISRRYPGRGRIQRHVAEWKKLLKEYEKAKNLRLDVLADLEKRIDKLGIKNFKRSGKGLAPVGMKQSEYATKSKAWHRRGAGYTGKYNVEQRLEEFAEQIEALIELEDEYIRMPKSSGQLNIEFEERKTKNALAKLSTMEAQYNAIRATEGKEAADAFLKSKKGLKALPLIGRIIVAGLMTDAAMKAFLFGFDGSEPGSEGLVKWLKAPFSNKGSARYMTAEMLPGLGEYLGIVDLSPVLFPGFKQQVKDMTRKAREGRLQHRGEERYTSDVEDYEATVQQAREYADRNPGTVVDLEDPTRVITRQEAARRRAAGRERRDTELRDPGGSAIGRKAEKRRKERVKRSKRPTTFQGQPAELQKVRPARARLRESKNKKPVRKINIKIG